MRTVSCRQVRLEVLPEMMVRPADQRVLDFLTGYESPVGAVALALREVMLEEAPGAIEIVYRNHPTAVWYGFGHKMKDMFCYIARAKTHVNLGFCRGASLPDPSNMLEGKGRVMRHVKFRSERDVERRFVRPYIRRAAGLVAVSPPRSKKRSL